MLKSILAYLGAIAKAMFVALKVKSICKSSATSAEKKAAVESKLEEFREACAAAASSTEADWDDKLFDGLASWLDEAAEAIVSKWGTPEGAAE